MLKIGSDRYAQPCKLRDSLVHIKGESRVYTADPTSYVNDCLWGTPGEHRLQHGGAHVSAQLGNLVEGKQGDNLTAIEIERDRARERGRQVRVEIREKAKAPCPVCSRGFNPEGSLQFRV